MKKIVVFLNRFFVPTLTAKPKQIEAFRKLIPDVEIVSCTEVEEFLAQLKEASAALVWDFKQAWFKDAQNLKYVITPAAGKDYFEVIPPSGVKVLNSSFHGQIMAETALGAMLSAARGIFLSTTSFASSSWPQAEITSSSRMFRGSTLTVLGFGNIGKETARLAHGFGVRVIGVKRQIKPSDYPSWFNSDDSIITIDKLESVLSETDHLFICLPRMATTTDLVNKRIFDLLPTHSWIYNLGRGNAVDEEALISALEKRDIAGAFLDVFKEEPLPADSPLRDCPYLFRMPHVSAICPEYLSIFFKELSERINKKEIIL